jgi:Flp pilus assembly protein CpaB
MSWKLYVPLGAVVILAGFATGIAVGRLGARRERKAAWKLDTVLVAARALPAGTVLTHDDLQLRGLPARFLTASNLRQRDASRTVGARLTAPVQEGDPLLAVHVVREPPAHAIDPALRPAADGQLGVKP